MLFFNTLHLFRRALYLIVVTLALDDSGGVGSHLPSSIREGVSSSERFPKLGMKTPSRRLARRRAQDISPLNHLKDNHREPRIHEDNYRESHVLN